VNALGFSISYQSPPNWQIMASAQLAIISGLLKSSKLLVSDSHSALP